MPPTEIVLEDRASSAKGKAASKLAAAKTPATKIAAQQPNGGAGETAVAANGKGSAPEEPIKVSALANVPAPQGKGSISGWLGLHKEPEAAPARGGGRGARRSGSPPRRETSRPPRLPSTRQPRLPPTSGQTSGAAAKDGAKKVTIGPLDKALRAADAQK